MKKLEPRVRESPASHRVSERRRELILYVEDDDDNWLVAELRLRAAYELLRATTSEQACRLLTQRGSELAAILMDIELRGSELNGVALTELLRGRHGRAGLPAYAQAVPTLSTPVLFVTAHGAKYSDAQLLAIGANAVIPKPVNFGELNIALTRLHLQRAQKR